mmetsp:Transcript_44895/g.70328  ORF Transcript_44895/g.70328 Transcript_44895/m.70328 type:complete len:262 (-) Transcript_44895:1730-2515(-)
MKAGAYKHALRAAMALISAASLVHGAAVANPIVPAALQLGAQPQGLELKPHSMCSGAEGAMRAQSMSMESRSSSEDDTSGNLKQLQSEQAPAVHVNVHRARDPGGSTLSFNLRGAGSQGDTLTVPVVFNLHSMPDAQDVTVVGSWSSWSDHYKLLKKGEGFDGVIDLPPGKHNFKFIVDGTWTTSDQFEVENDEGGHSNNVIEVVAPTSDDGGFKGGLTQKGSAPDSLLLKPVQLIKSGFQCILWPFKLLASLLFGKKADS